MKYVIVALNNITAGSKLHELGSIICRVTMPELSETQLRDMDDAMGLLGASIMTDEQAIEYGYIGKDR